MQSLSDSWHGRTGPSPEMSTSMKKKKLTALLKLPDRGGQAVPALPLRFRRSPVSTIHTAASTDRMDGWHGRWGIFGARTRI